MVILLNIHLIREYVKKMTKDDVKNIALSKEIKLSDREINDVYNYIKNNYKNFLYGKLRPDDVLEDAQLILSEINYSKFESLYKQYINKI